MIREWYSQEMVAVIHLANVQNIVHTHSWTLKYLEGKLSVAEVTTDSSTSVTTLMGNFLPYL